MILIAILYVFLRIYNASSTPVEQSEVDLDSKAQKCIEGAEVQNDWMQCVCNSDKVYHCKKQPYNNGNEDNILIGKRYRATCIPHLTYTFNKYTCVCNADGYWPHDKCDSVFKSLHIQTLSAPKPSKCEPDSFVIVECNVCRCGSDGFIDKHHCTKNNCTNGKVQRRSSANVLEGSCKAGSWYSLAPCQFCHCASDNRLVCSTGNTRAKIVERGPNNLTLCGENLLNEIVELVPDSHKVLRERENEEDNENLDDDGTADQEMEISPIETTSGIPVIETKVIQNENRNDGSALHIKGNSDSTEEDTQVKDSQSAENVKANVKVARERPEENIPVNNVSPLENNKTNEEAVAELSNKAPVVKISPEENNEAESESASKETEVKSFKRMTELPYKSDKESVEESNDAQSVEVTTTTSPPPAPITPKPVHRHAKSTTVTSINSIVSEQPLLTAVVVPEPQPEELIPVIKPKKTSGQTTQNPNIVRIQLPSVFDKLLSLAMRKSMVTLEKSEAKCTPGETTHNKCNFCYCLVNGKMLCTAKDDKCQQ